MIQLLHQSRPGQKKKFVFGVQWKITLIVVAVVAIFIAFIFGYILPQMEKSLYETKPCHNGMDNPAIFR